MRNSIVPILVAGALALPPTSGVAAPADDDEGDASASASGEASLGGAKGEASSSNDDEKWIKRWRPAAMMGEVGIYGGVLLPSRQLELFEPDDAEVNQGFKRYNRVAPDIGLRGGFYPIRFFGAEAEVGVMPTKAGGGRATLWTVRGHLVGQLGLWSVTPFILFGVGALGVGSPASTVGSDTDVALHGGGGVKIFFNRWVQLRFDARDIISNEQGVADGLAHSFEGLVSLVITFRRKKQKKQGPKDSDGDGFLDDEDDCVHTPGVAPDGCPINDRDGDGFVDDEDKCPDEPGIEPDGCPRPDRDGDKIADDDDKCPDDPETKNGFKDEDGCPDELPKEIEEFTGVIQGVQFDVDKATIKRKSKTILDKAAAILKKHPNIRVEIGGHTDSTGPRDHNLDLSRRRARSVKAYLVKRGIKTKRLETRGFGPDQPVASNDTDAGRQQNRRIEFKVISR